MAAPAETIRVDQPVSEGSVLAFPLIVWMIWRVCHAGVLVAVGGDLVGDAFRFDGQWFLTVLHHGYVLKDASYATQQNVAFFPGLVWLTEPFSWVLGDRAAAIFVANVTGAAAFVAVYGATRCITGSDRVGRRSTIGLAVWPASIVMTAFYSEGLFVTATAAAIWAAKRDRHAAGCVAAFVAGITRSIGFLLGPVLAVVRCIRLRRIDRTTVAYASSGPIGLGLVAVTQRLQVDDPWAFAKAQTAWDRTLSGPWVPLYRAGHTIIEAMPRPELDPGLNLAAVVLVGLALLGATLRFHRRESVRGFLGWGWVAWFAPLCTVVPSSQIRFALGAWPALAVAGYDESRWARRARVTAAAMSVVISVVLIRRWATGVFIG